MTFTSINFAVFLPVVFLLYWFVCRKTPRSQNVLLLAASYLFYGWWDWRFLSLIIFSSLVDFLIGLALEKEKSPCSGKILLGMSLVVNLGLLGFFKYFNFFLDSLYDVIPGLQAILGFNTLNIILPVGISFYTFQTLSYTIDVYKKRINATNDYISFATFVGFFPQLVAGPIERATNLLPQFQRLRIFSYKEAVEGLRQILWGLFKKMVIADNCAVFANLIFDNPGSFSGSTLLLGAVFFSFQIYGDFSGYSDIAIGTSKLFGINLMQNFSYPYFSRDFAEFWRRWHISLSTWFRDYLYIPLGGSRGSKLETVRNILLIFLISGLWHGANWTFLAWGGLNAFFFFPLLLKNLNRKNLKIVAHNRSLPTLQEFFSMVATFFMITLTWCFFRAEDLPHGIQFISKIFSASFFTFPDFPGKKDALITAFLIVLLVIIEWVGRKKKFPLEDLNIARPVRHLVYYSLILAIIVFSAPKQEFIYFQF
ncbi:MBOAT family O-acyltransferase [Salinimicrobium sp. WS361]|uniref:MBOAT family O-acyltransferase n=1 Tax=Salinimicrobium sp. WS361 TaxID=3425123 RepID=UPI003D6E76A1